MSLTITTLNNETPTSNNFVEIKKDSVTAEWYNTSLSVAGGLDCRLFVKQSPNLAKTKTGVPIRRSLVQCVLKAPVVATIGGNSTTIWEEVTVNLTVTSPTGLATLTAAQREHALAFVRNFATAATLAQLMRGEL